MRKKGIFLIANNEQQTADAATDVITTKKQQSKTPDIIHVNNQVNQQMTWMTLQTACHVSSSFTYD